MAQRETAIKHPHLSALICFMMAGLLYFTLPSKEYGGAFLLLGLFFEFVGLKMMFARKTK